MEFFSLNSQVHSTEEQKAFWDLLEHMQQISNLKSNYQRNRQLLKSSGRILKDLPTLVEIQQFYIASHALKIKRKTKALLFSKKMTTLIVWLISTYEIISENLFENFNDEDWERIAQFIPNCSFFLIKYKWFTLLSSNNANKIWQGWQNEKLLDTINKFSSKLLLQNTPSEKSIISWSQISIEFCKDIKIISDFKTDKQCKERWFNHLNPNLKRKDWSLEEDIRLMEENLLNLKKWAQISRSFIGRNQHQVKNRFIVLIQREIDIDKATIRRLLKKNQITIFIKDTLRNLQIKLQGNKSYQSYEDLQPSLSQSETTTISDENFSQLMQEIDDLNDQFNISQFYENDFGGSFTELYLNCNAWLKN